MRQAAIRHKRVTWLALFLSLFSGVVLAHPGYLRDRHGQLMRGTPMSIGHHMAGTVSAATRIDNWRWIKEDLHLNTVRLCWVDNWLLNRRGETTAESAQEIMPVLDRCVENATRTGLNIIINYHVTAEQQKWDTAYTFKDVAAFWRLVAQRYRDNDLVYYELVNEPVWTIEQYLDPVFKKNLMGIYRQVRDDAPQRKILMFSFHQNGYAMERAIDDYAQELDWSHTVVAYHLYGHTDTQRIQVMAKQYPLICSEWGYPGPDYVKVVDGCEINAQALEAIGASWIDWKGWGDTSFDKVEQRLLPDARARGYTWWDSAAATGHERRPIVDTHIHFYQVTRAGGVPWPPRRNRILYRDILPGDYKEVAKPLGIIASGIVEASPLPQDNLWVLNLVAEDPFFPFFVANLKPGSAEFLKNLDELLPHDRFVGIRASLRGSPTALDAAQLEHFTLLAQRGLTLDLLSRGKTNPKARIAALARAMPDLRIIIDHLGGARTEQVDPQWKHEIELLAANPNVSMKFSSFCDMFQPATRKGDAWQSPTNLSAYQPHFDVLMNAFGPDRLVWGSNWPVVLMGGSLEDQIRLAEEFLKPFGTEVRDKVMRRNALRFYRRTVP